MDCMYYIMFRILIHKHSYSHKVQKVFEKKASQLAILLLNILLYMIKYVLSQNSSNLIAGHKSRGAQFPTKSDS